MSGPSIHFDRAARRGVPPVLLLCALAAATLYPTGCGEPVATGDRDVPPPTPAPVAPFDMPHPDAVLLVTGGTEGVIEVCNCQGPMPGSLARRGGLVHSYRAAFPNTLLVDLGNTFWIQPEDLRNPFLWRGYRRMDYDAVVPGSHEWAMDGRRLRRLLDETGLTPLATTVSAPHVEPADAVTRTWPTARVAVVADVRPSALAYVPPDRREHLRVAPTDDLARRIAELKRGGFVVVVALHGSRRDVASAAGLGADLVLRGHTKRSDPDVSMVNGTPVIQVGGYTEVGVVALACDGPRLADLEFRLETVDTRWPVDARVEAVYKRYGRAAMRVALAAPRTEGLDYVPSAECGRCHEVQYAAWKKTPHAHAWETLVEADRTMDPDCVRCHTTGFGTEKGFYTIEKTPAMANVNCQGCHHLEVAGHLKDDWRPRPVTSEVCTACHTAVTDPGFRFETKRSKMGCPPDPAPAGARRFPRTRRARRSVSLGPAKPM
jgi:hypothetical protein